MSCTHQVNTWRTFFQLWPVIRPFKKGLVVAAIALIVNAVVDITLLYLIKPLLDKGFWQSDCHFLKQLPLLIIGLFLLRGISQFFSRYGFAWASGYVVMNLRQRLFDHLLKMPVSFFDQQATATLISRLTYDIEQVAATSSEALAILLRESVYIIGLLCVMFYLSWQLASILWLVAPWVAFIIHHISSKFRTIGRAMQDAVGAITERSEQMLKGHKEMLIFGGQEVELERFILVSNQMRQQKMKMVAAVAIADPLTQLIASIALSFVLYMATFPHVIIQLTAGTFSVMFTSMFSLMRPLKSLTHVNMLFQRGIAACQTIFRLLNLPTASDNGGYILQKIEGRICWCDVTFFYPNKEVPALQKVNLTIPIGHKVALIGRSGAGKSTFVHLLMRFYDPQQGAILVNGRDLRSYTLRSLRSQITLVSQQIHLFHDTIARNIAYGCTHHCSDEEIEEAARLAHVLDFSVQLEHGLNTVIGENGVLLSGGQRQRIAIARALLKNSPILILDEATSALDSNSEQLIQGVLQKLQRGRTVLIIAHRLSTIEQVDQIVFIEQGKIVETGSHITLLARQGHYAQWYMAQSGQSIYESIKR